LNLIDFAENGSYFGTNSAMESGRKVMATLNGTQIDAALRDLAGWNSTGKDIRKEFKFPNFIEAMGFVNRVAEIAEETNHHPDIEIRYNKVVLSLTSHDVGGVTDRDVRLARSIDGLLIA
jgi:4a-hydroxytetrahydrobiopterin dehydratase